MLKNRNSLPDRSYDQTGYGYLQDISRDKNQKADFKGGG